MRKSLLCLLVVLVWTIPAFAHSGRTDSSGGHYNRSTGEYHYHHGYAAHSHEGGVCPYDNVDRTGQSSGSSWGTYVARTASSAQTTDYRSLVLSCVVGICGGLSVVFVQNRRAHKRLEETERRLLERSQDAINALIAEYEHRERTNESNRQYNCKMYAQMALESKTYSDRVKNVQKIVENTTIPDMNDGVVYVTHDISQRMYHNNHEACGIKDMILISKRSAVRYGLKQCPVCNSAKQPETDLPVVIPFTGSGKCYHVVGTYCLTVSRESTLSAAKAKGYIPCTRCKPPTENPKVWF